MYSQVEEFPGSLDIHISSAQQVSKRGGLTRRQLAVQAWGGFEPSSVYTARCWGWGCGCGCCAGSQWLLRTCNLLDDNATWQPRGQSPYNFLSPLWVIGDLWTCPSYKGRDGKGKGIQGEEGETGQGILNRDTRKRGDRVIKRKGRQRAGQRKIKETRAGRKRLISFTVDSLEVQQRQKKSAAQLCLSHIQGKWETLHLQSVLYIHILSVYCISNNVWETESCAHHLSIRAKETFTVLL